MSEVVCRCPACSAKFKVDAKYAGKKARCPKCAVVVEVPAAGAESLTSTSVQAGQSPSNSTTVQPSVTTQSPPKAVPPKAVPVAGGLSSSHVAAGPAPPAPVARALPARPVAPPPEQALNALVEEPTPPASAATASAAPASDSFGFQINTKSKASKTSTMSSSAVGGPALNSEPTAAPQTQPQPASHGKKDSGNAFLVIFAGIGGVLLLAALAVGRSMVMSGTGTRTTIAKNDGPGKANKSTNQAAAPKGSGKLVIDFPEADRKGGFALVIDGRREPSIQTGELSFDLKAGDHKLLLQRRGYENVDATVTVVAGAVANFKPNWVKVEAGSPASSVVANRPTTPGSGGTNFQIGTATGSPVKGFEGFIQNFGLAKEQAAKSQKSVLLVIAQSDAEPRSMELGRATQQQAIKDQIESAFVPVIVDFPRGPEARSNLWDEAQNAGILDEYNLRRGRQIRVPVLLFVDPKGKPFFIETEFAQGLSNLSSYLTAGAAARSERDSLLSAIKNDSLDPTVKAVAWLKERKIIGSFEQETKEWLAVGRRLDANNDQAQLECLVEGHLLAKMSNIDFDDQIEVKQFVDLLADWLTNRKFKDDDRGAQLHLFAGQILSLHGLRNDANKHLARAGSYSPKDEKLKEQLAQAKLYIERGSILSNGTGFVISEAGYIMTNHHVIDGPGKVMIRLADNKTLVPGTVVVSDAKRDMAIVKIDVPAGVKLTAVPVSPAAIGRGIDVAAFGYPLAGSVGASLKFTKGGVSALPDDTNEQMIMLDLRVNPGNSGGPLCDQRGNVVGMVSAKTRSNMFTNEDSLGLAIPSGDLVAYLDKHLPQGTPRAPPSSAPDGQQWSAVDAQVSPAVLLILKMQ